jgi:hypothetical protein
MQKGKKCAQNVGWEKTMGNNHLGNKRPKEENIKMDLGQLLC